MLFVGRESRGGAGFCPGGVSRPYRSIGVFEKNLQKFLEHSEFVWHGCGHGAEGGIFWDATNQELPKSNPGAPASQRGSLSEHPSISPNIL